MEKFEELKAWADKWDIPYEISEYEDCLYIAFDSITWCDAMFSCNKKTGDYVWYGGD